MYRRYEDLYNISIRNALITQTFRVQKLEKYEILLNKLNDYPILKKILKKLYHVYKEWK